MVLRIQHSSSRPLHSSFANCIGSCVVCHVPFSRTIVCIAQPTVRDGVHFFLPLFLLSCQPLSSSSSVCSRSKKCFTIRILNYERSGSTIMLCRNNAKHLPRSRCGGRRYFSAAKIDSPSVFQRHTFSKLKVLVCFSVSSVVGLQML